MTKISIILPIYNVAQYLPKCIDSVLNQTLKEIEVILATDGPADCDEICASYAKQDKRVKVISHPGGYGKAVNQGIDMAKGKYIGIVETDDWCDLTMFEKLYAAAEKYEADVAKCGFYFSYDSNPYERINSMEIDGCFNPKEHMYLLRFQPSVWSAIYLKSFLDKNKIRFMEEKKLSYIDSPFHEETFLKAKRYASITEPLYFYYQGNPNASVKSTEKVLDGIKTEQFIFDKLSADKKSFNNIKEIFLETTALHLKWNWERMKTKKGKQEFWCAAHEYVKQLDIDNATFCEFYDANLKDFLINLNNYSDYKKVKPQIHEYNVKTRNLRVLGIPLLKIKKCDDAHRQYYAWLLFDKIVLFKIKFFKEKTIFRLFNFLPVLTIKK